MMHAHARLLLFALALVGAASFLVPDARAQAGKWPERPVKVIIPFAPGGPNDNIARIWTDRLGQAYGQPFVIDNRGGATGLIGTEAVTRAAPDGYTLLFGSTSVLASSLVVRKTAVDPIKDLTPIARTGDLVSGWAVHPSVPVNTIDEFKDYVRKNPGKLAYGTSGVGSLNHLLLEAIRMHAGLDILHVPYRGTLEALNDLNAGIVQVMIDSTFFGQKGSSLKFLAVLLPERLPERPDLPTLVEAGMIPTVMTTWYGFYGPAGLPREIANNLNAKIAELGKQPETVRILRERGAALTLMSPEDTAKSLATQVQMNRDLVEKVGIKAE